MKIGFNKPYFTGKEFDYINDAIRRKHVSGNGYFTQKCQSYIEERYGFKKCLLTTSCTDALEMSAILIGTQSGDEIIMPSYTFASTANAFILRGAIIRFVDSRSGHPGMDESKIEEFINSNTKAIVVVHYAGVACDMDLVMELAKKHNLFVIEDAAQAIDSYYKSKPLGGIGHLGCFSFHETKNISCGEGGMLVINDDRFLERAEIIWEKGTNRAAFFRGEVDKYGWVDIGSSFLSSDINAAFLFAQLEEIENIQKKRKWVWYHYYQGLINLEKREIITLPKIPDYASNNGHMFYIICTSLTERNALINFLNKKKIHTAFHYQSLHKSPYYYKLHDGRKLPNSERLTDCLLRLPFYFDITEQQVAFVISSISDFYSSYS